MPNIGTDIKTRAHYRLKMLWLESEGSYYAFDIHMHKAEVLDLVGDWQESLDILNKSHLFAQKAGAKKQEADSEIRRVRLLRYMGRGQDLNPSLDQAMSVYRELNDQCGINQTLNEIGLAYRFSGNIKEAEKSFAELISRGEISGDTKHQMSGLGNLSQIHMINGKFQEALDCLERCEKISGSQNDKTFSTILLGSIGNAHFFLEDYGRALEYYQKQLQLAYSLGDLANISVAVGNIGNIHNRRGEIEKALKCYQEKLDISQKLGYATGTQQALGNMGLILSENGNYEEARKYFERQLAVSIEADETEGIEGACSGLGAALLHLGDFENSERYLNKAISLDIERNLQGDLGSNYCILAELFLKKGDTAKARESAKKALAIGQEIEDEDLVNRALTFIEIR